MALWSRILNWFIYFIILALLFRALGGIVRIVMYLVPPRQKCATRIKRGRPPEEEAWEVAAKAEARGPLPSLQMRRRGAPRRRRYGPRDAGVRPADARGPLLRRSTAVAADILKNWDVVQGEWVPLLPFAMKIGSDLYHPAHGGDERTRSGSYTRAVNGCFDPTAGGEKKE